MSKYITWFDVENEILRRKYAGTWPDCIVSVNVYQDEVEISVDKIENKDIAARALREWFGAKYDLQEEKLYLEYAPGEDIRFLTVAFDDEFDIEKRPLGAVKPNFANVSLYPKKSSLKGPAAHEDITVPPIWAFYSFKGGVSRTLHLVSLVKALSEQSPPKKVLIVDGDLEAPGLTWWAEEQLGNFEISFLDFLALAHYDTSIDYNDSLGLTVDRLRKQMLTFETKNTIAEHFFLPSFRDVQQLMRIPIRPEHVCWEAGKEWLISELLRKLGRKLGVDAVVVDLRAGLSEISSPLLFDPWTNRVIVTTPSGQSVHGTKLVLKQIQKVTETLDLSPAEHETLLPTVILSMIKEDLKKSSDFETVREDLIGSIVPETSSDIETATDADNILLGKDVLVETLFDEKLLYLKNLESTLDRLEGTNLAHEMARIANERLPVILPKENESPPMADYKKVLQKLKDASGKYEYAESGKAETFLTTPNLRATARKFEKNVPTAVLMGAKGAGKTYTYLQMVRLKQWSAFINKVNGEVKDKFGFIWPLMTSKNLEDEAREIINSGRDFIREKSGLPLSTFKSTDLGDRLNTQYQTGDNDTTSWRKFWIRLLAESLGCENEAEPVMAMQSVLNRNNSKIVFLVDGIEDYFVDVKDNNKQQNAIVALCQDLIALLQEFPDNRIGLLVFIRKDMVRSAITQNFGQFENRYKTMELKWDREEALRLVAWLVRDAAGLGLPKLKPDIPIDSLPAEVVEQALEGLWGLKLGSPKSREAYTANWVISALSDFNGHLQARDVVRLIHYAADNASKLDEYPGRLLPPAALKDALAPCSKKKINEIEIEITLLKDIFKNLSRLAEDKRQIPFDRDDVGLGGSEIEIMSRLGIITEYEGKYYFPEIIRHGLGFKLASRGRLKVVSLLKKALNG